MALSRIDSSYDLTLIAKNAGQLDIDKILYKNGELFVEDVSQEALDGAIANYDHLTSTKNRYLVQLDAHAFGSFKLDDKLIAIHTAKHKEATALMGADPQLSTPLIDAEVAVLAIDKTTLANIIIAKYDEYIALVAKVEAIRIQAKNFIRAETSFDNFGTIVGDAKAAFDLLQQ